MKKLFGGDGVRSITRFMVNEFKIKEMGYDFMGYHLNEGDIYTFHHLIIPNRENGPYHRWNGAILCGSTSHPYLHKIEEVDYDMFAAITSEMVDINFKGYLDPTNIKNIDDVLRTFEREHCSDRAKGGKPLIKEIYTQRVKL